MKISHVAHVIIIGGARSLFLSSYGSGLWRCSQGLAHLGVCFGWASPKDKHTRNHIVSSYCLEFFYGLSFNIVEDLRFFLPYSSRASVLDLP